jgi:hypothetical protein
MRRLIPLLLALTLPQVVMAQTHPENLVTFNTRTFDLGTDASQIRRDADFVPMNEIDWLSPILNADPALGAAVFHLKMAHPSTTTADHRWSFDGNLGRDFQYDQNIPEMFVIDGLETRSRHEDGSGGVLMIATDPQAAYSVTCDLNRDGTRVSLCVVRASYPPDPLIYLQARLYFPDPWNVHNNPFAPIADRMREMARCLDITDRELEVTAEGVPLVAGCRDGVGA